MSVANVSSTIKNNVLHAKEIKLEWEIKNFWDLHGEVSISSPTFPISNADWFLACYPNGHTFSKTDGFTSLYLYKKASPSGLYVAVTLGIMKADGSVFKSFSYNFLFPKEETGKAAQSKFLRRSELNNSKDVVSPNGVLIVFCFVRLCSHIGLDAASQTTFSDSVDTLSQNIKELYVSGYESDVTIRVKDKEFLAHKLILSTRSTVFRSMFELDMAEKRNGEVNITDCEPECVENFLLFLYSSKLDMVSASNAESLYLIADKYNIQDLKLACSNCMAREISIDSLCDVVHLASLHNETELLSAATRFFTTNANSILPTLKWLSFVTEHPILANELFMKFANSKK